MHDRVANHFDEVNFIDVQTVVLGVEFELDLRITFTDSNGLIGANGDFDLCRVSIHGIHSGELVHGGERHAGAAGENQDY